MRPAKVANRYKLGHYVPLEVAAMLLFTAAVLMVFVTAGGAWLGAEPFTGLPWEARAGFYCLALAGSCCIAYGILIEPYMLTVRAERISSPKLRGEVRLLHLSDLHVRDWSRLEDALVATSRALQPDLILISGDFTSVPTSLPAAQRLMKAIAEIAPTFCSRGNSEYRKPPFEDVTRGSEARWLLNETVTLEFGGSKLAVTGADTGDESSVRPLGEAVDPACYSVCMYHYPDLVPELGSLPFDLLLCGHSHGGQIRLPLIGAVIGASRAGRRYVKGLFRSGDKAANISAGIGCRSYGLPRMRYMCPPEAVLITLAPGAGTGA